MYRRYIALVRWHWFHWSAMHIPPIDVCQGSVTCVNLCEVVVLVLLCR